MALTLNGPKGLGDAIYLRALALHLIAKGEEVAVCTRWPEVFVDLPVQIKSADVFEDYDTLSHMIACLHCQVAQIRNIDKFRLACLQAGIDDPVALRMDWKVRNPGLVDKVRRAACGRPILLYQPLKRAGNVEQELMRPDRAAYNGFVQGSDGYLKVKVGSAGFLDQDNHPPCDLDLMSSASVSDVFDIATAADLVFSESSFLLILAQAAERNLVAMFSRRAIESKNKRVGGSRPERLIVKPHLASIIFDE